ncbi:MAG TPA: DUF1361 domain-containing protein [Saprospiraceae bacterium]|nr:DUF1361 domain-containing protein [Saprospiraceae bacterium]
MIQKLIHSGRFKLILLLALMSVFCFSLSVFRFYFSETKTFLFLNWNLFLAFIPWFATTLIILSKRLRTNKIALMFVLVVWLLFFPNAPYILTDLFHLRVRSAIPIWYDLVVILSFAWTGLTFGFLSLVDIESLASKYMPARVVRFVLFVLLFAGSFGIYLGRYLRWNSWDIFNNPFSLLSEIGDRFIDPFSHPRTWGMTILFGVLLNMRFWTFKLFAPNEMIKISDK